jgi:serine/threonine-protein kinase PknG
MDGGMCQVTPGCTGIIEEGYCTVCGKIAAARPGTVATLTGRPFTVPATVATNGSATTAGRTGTVDTAGTSETAGTSGTSDTYGSSAATGTDGTSSTGYHHTTGASRRSRSTSRRPSARSRIGAGLVTVPPMPTQDPAAVVMTDPEVAEDKRFCAKCGSEVGRSRDGKPGRVTGFCSKCRHPYSFLPPLGRGDLVAGQYRIAGCLAYGGLGWIYLAQDEQVSNRWVVLKGLLNSGDVDAMAAAVAERQFLARVEHPSVVRIYNFVQQDRAGYIVMEYVGGKPLKEVLRERRRATGGDGALPVEHAIAYILGILPAFSYLHRLGLVYNDFKPDNVMLHGDDLKLIDLGAVTRADDSAAAIYGTDGYQAPEVARHGPSPASDLYTIARCLAVLTLDFRGYQTKFRYSLPDPADYPVLERHESLHRFLLKGTAESPDDRFQNADEMAEQLLGVLREVVARNESSPKPAPSTLFGVDLQALRPGTIPGGAPDWRHLPALKVNPADRAASLVVNVAALGEPSEQVAQIRRAILDGQVPETAEARLGLARALVWLGEDEEAERQLEAVNREDPWDWRVTWYRGLRLLARGEAPDARQAFERVGFDLPGELAPKLAEAMAAELAGDLHRAALLYDVVSTTDPDYTSACFGLGRVRAALGDRPGAVEAYERIPENSSLYVPAQLALARALMGNGHGPMPNVQELVGAGQTIQRLDLDGRRSAQLSIELLNAGLRLLRTGAAPDSRTTLIGRALRETELRFGLEEAYRELARLAVGDEKIRLVDEANRVRPLTAV